LKIHSNNPTTSNEWIRQYLNFANQKAWIEIRNSINVQNKIFTDSIKHQISEVMEVARKMRVDRVEQLTEALKIAKATGIETQITKDANELNQPSLMYMRGTKALAAEIQVLKGRKVEQPRNIHNLRKLESMYNYYSNIEIPKEPIKIYRLDGAIDTTDTPVSPRKSLILFLGIMGGLILGIIAGILQNLVLQPGLGRK
jgi:chain length determinant protein (polysaccharide antigen chain regulator)